jgi:hypothetical protein
MNDENVLLQQVLNVVSAIEIAKIHKGEKFDSDEMIKTTISLYDSLVGKLKD